MIKTLFNFSSPESLTRKNRASWTCFVVACDDIFFVAYLNMESFQFGVLDCELSLNSYIDVYIYGLGAVEDGGDCGWPVVVE